jgi:Halocarboxylic acid dehydrogenase DehI
MALQRVFEEHEVGPDIRRIYSEIRANFDIPFVPTIFKVLAGEPDYFRQMWRDLGPVAASREFHQSASALDEYIRSEAISGGWRFGDQERTLAEQKVSTTDMPVLGGVIGVFARSLPRMAIFSRLMQMGYSGGQQGRISTGKTYPALSRLISLHIPAEREASLRVWLIYSDIRRNTGAKHITSMYRALSPFPAYLASSWMDSKKLLKNRDFQSAKDGVSRRTQALSIGLPVGDHRMLIRGLSPQRWRDIEHTTDGFVRSFPQLALLAWVWRRSFATSTSRAA